MLGPRSLPCAIFLYRLRVVPLQFEVLSLCFDEKKLVAAGANGKFSVYVASVVKDVICSLSPKNQHGHGGI